MSIFNYVKIEVLDMVTFLGGDIHVLTEVRRLEPKKKVTATVGAENVISGVASQHEIVTRAIDKHSRLGRA